jgi:hypothetical protein
MVASGDLLGQSESGAAATAAYGLDTWLASAKLQWYVFLSISFCSSTKEEY